MKGSFQPVVLLLFLASPSLAAPTAVRDYQGTVDIRGHYPVPHESRAFESRLHTLRDRAGRLRLEWTTREPGDSTESTEVTLVRGDSVFVRGDSGQWGLQAGERAIEARMQALALFPESFPDDIAKSSRDEHGRLNSVVRERAHPRLGDVDDRIDYRYTEEPGEEQEIETATRRDGLGETDRESLENEEEQEEARRVIPHGITMTIHERDQDWTATIDEVSAGRLSIPDSLFAAPPSFDPPEPDEYTLRGDVVFSDVAPGLVLANMDDIGSRSMIAEFADSLIVMECAVSSANGERLVDAIAKRWPGKPIRWFLFSHHHPHYLGGLRAMVAAGAGVGTTPGNEAYVREIVAWPFTRSPDRLAQHPVPLRVRTSADRLEFADATNRLVAVNFGSRWEHTKEALVFWFPKQKVLFETEQGWFTKDGTLTASRRAAGLLKLIEDEKWEPERIAQSWPMEGTEAVVTRTKLAELVAARGK